MSKQRNVKFNQAVWERKGKVNLPHTCVRGKGGEFESTKLGKEKNFGKPKKPQKRGRRETIVVRAKST